MSLSKHGANKQQSGETTSKRGGAVIPRRGRTQDNLPLPESDRVAPPDAPRALTIPEERAPRRRKRRRPPPPPQPSRQPRGCMSTCALYGGLSLLAMTLVLAFLIVVMTVQTVDFLRDPLDNFLAVFGFDQDAEPEVVDSTVIVLGIREMSLLQTASASTQIVKTVVDSGASPDARLRMSYIGTVDAGIDLNLVTDEDIVVNSDNSLTVYLPPIQLLDCALRDPEVIDIDCLDIPVLQDCGGIRTDLQEEAYQRSLEALVQKALEGELTTPNGVPLLEVAYDNAEATLYDFIERLGFAEVTFIRSIETLPPGPTCTP